MSKISARIQTRLDAIRSARLAAAMNPSRGRHALVDILRADWNEGTRDIANIANALLTVSLEILEGKVAPWDFTWDAINGLNPETSRMAAARLLGASEETGDVDKFIMAVAALKPLLEKEQASAAAARLLEAVAATGTVGDISVAGGKLARANLVTAPQIDGVLNAACDRLTSQIPWPAEVSETDAVREAA